MKPVCCFVFCLLLSIVCAAQRFTYNSGSSINKNYYEEIPYETVSGKIFITVEVNGKKRKFLFDTGAPVQITPELYTELKLSFTRRTYVTDANGATDSVNVVSVPQIKINSLLFTGVPALVSGADIYKCMDIDGVIGSNLVYKSIVRIDPARHIITLTDDEKRLHLEKKNYATMVTDMWQGFPFVVVWLPGKKQTFLAGFDTGDSGLLAITETEMNRFSKKNVFKKESAGYGAGHRGIFGLQKYDSTYRLKFPVLSIGGYEFNNVTTETNKTNLTRLGTKILDYGTVTLDFIHHRIYFEPNRDKIDLDEKQWPLQPIIDSNKLEVGVVWQALNGQASPGEQIIAIDDVPCLIVDLCDYYKRGASLLNGKQTAVLTIKDEKGVIKKINIAKQ